jgi:hypothetical protein
MNQDSLDTSFWTMILLQTIGSVDPMPGTTSSKIPGAKTRKMPSPRSFVTTIVAWSVLQLAANAGYEDGAAKFGWLMVLANLVLGPGGKRIAKLFQSIVKIYGHIDNTNSLDNQVTTP